MINDSNIHPLTVTSVRDCAVRDWTIGTNGLNNPLGALLVMHRVPSQVQKGMHIWGYKLDFQIRKILIRSKSCDVESPYHTNALPYIMTHLWVIIFRAVEYSHLGWRCSSQLMGHDWFNYTEETAATYQKMSESSSITFYHPVWNSASREARGHSHLNRSEYKPNIFCDPWSLSHSPLDGYRLQTLLQQDCNHWED